MGSNQKHPNQQDSSNLKDAMFTAGDAVLGAAVLIFIGAVAGNWLDHRFHSAPLGIVTLPLVGAGLGLWRMIRKAMTMDSDSKDKPNTSSTGSAQTHKPYQAKTKDKEET
jgi:F0F1-type ATP synthase assembly protein I